MILFHEPTNSHEMASSNNNSQSSTGINERMKLNQAMQGRLPGLKAALTYAESGPDNAQIWIATYTITWLNGQWLSFTGTGCSTKDVAAENAAATTRTWIETNCPVASTLPDTLVPELGLK
jgi:hypothetical protein